jgi:nucleoside-triphosphatase
VKRKKNILVTGAPGTGKTTLLIELADRLSDMHPVGFYTQEIREAGTRMGFEIVGLDGRRGVLAHVRIRSPPRVAKYGVDVSGFEAFLAGLEIPPESSLVILDEIGKMECLSAGFRQRVQELLDGKPILLATIALRGDAFIESLKHREDVQIYVLTRETRDSLLQSLVNTVRALVA